MSRYIDLTGQRFGKLVVKEYAPSDGRKGAFWLCQCDCGNTTVVAGQELRRACMGLSVFLWKYRHITVRGPKSWSKVMRLYARC